MRQNGVFAIWLLLIVALPPAAAAAGYDDLNRGIQMRNQGNWDSAVAAFDMALAGNDLPPGLQYVAHLDRGEGHLNLGHVDLAIADFTASLALRPGDPVALSERSVAYLRAGKPEAAAADLDGVIAGHSLDTRAILRRAILEVRLGRADQAIQDLKTIRTQQPDNAALYRPMGVADWQLGQIQDAETDFTNALSKRSDDAYAWLWLSLAEARLNKPAPHLPDFDRKTWPGPIIDLFLGSGSPEAVFAAAGNGANANGQLCEANFYVGEWLLQHRDAAAARPLIVKAASRCPRDFVEWAPAQSELTSLP